MPICTDCKRYVASGVRFCENCGTEQSIPCCKACGVALPSAYSYACPACGEKQTTVSSSAIRQPSMNKELTHFDQQPDDEQFIKPATRTRVLYLVPRSRQQNLRSIFYSIHRQNQGDVLWVDAETALEQAQKRLKRDHKRIFCVCIIGTANDIPHVQWENAVTEGLAGMEKVETDNPYGMLYNPSLSERMTGHIVNDIPVTRIPTLNKEELLRLLAISTDLPSDWQNGLAVSAKVWSGPSQFSLRQIAGEHSVPLLFSPPNTEDLIAQQIGTRKPSRLCFNVHGHNVMTDWYGDGDGQNPIALKASSIQIESNGVVFSEACYGAMINDQDTAISSRFLQKGAGAFIGSTIIAWGAVGEKVVRGSGADSMVEFFYLFLDQGYPLGEALRLAKLRLLQEYQDDNGVIDYITHNTIGSFVAYGAPSAAIQTKKAVASAEYKQLCSLNPSRIVSAKTTKSTLQKYRERLQGKLPEDVWRSLSEGQKLVAPVQLPISDDAKRLLGDVKLGFLWKIRSGTQIRTYVMGTDEQQYPQKLLLLDPAGEVQATYVVR